MKKLSIVLAAVVSVAASMSAHAASVTGKVTAIRTPNTISGGNVYSIKIVPTTGAVATFCSPVTAAYNFNFDASNPVHAHTLQLLLAAYAKGTVVTALGVDECTGSGENLAQLILK
jgi:hypothetical protein